MSAKPNIQYVAATPRWIVPALAILFALAGYLAYSGRSMQTALETAMGKANDQNKLLAAQLEQMNSRVADLDGDVELTSQKLGLTQTDLARARALAQKARKEQKAESDRLSAQIGQVRQDTDTKIGQVSTDLNGAKSDIESTKKDLEGTKGRLEGAIGDLGVHSGLIARNQDELEELKRRGERNIFEFDLRRSKRPTRVGPFQLTLNKVDPKRYRYSMTVLVNDRSIQKRDRTVDEPVQFYLKGTHVPCEIVVFEVSKGHAVGYVSTPKAGAA